MADKRSPDRSFYQDLREGAALAGEPVPDWDDVAEVTALLAEADRALVPPDLVPDLVKALTEEGERTEEEPSLGAGSLLRLVWAEARFMPLAFFATEAVLLAAALLINYVLVRGGGFSPGDWLVGAFPLGPGGFADGFTLVAPWLGAAAGLFSLRPAGRGAWVELEAVSPFSPGVRLLVRAALATIAALAGTVVGGLISQNPGSATSATLLLARTAPLLLAVGWALVWAVRFGAGGGIAASAGLWVALAALGSRLGGWSLLFVPDGLGQAAPQWAALAVAAACWAGAVWQARRLSALTAAGGR